MSEWSLKGNFATQYNTPSLPYSVQPTKPYPCHIIEEVALKVQPIHHNKLLPDLL